MFSWWTVDQALAMDDGPSFKYHYGSYPTRKRQVIYKKTHKVSIPLWFLANDGYFISAIEMSFVFPYHYGS